MQSDTSGGQGIDTTGRGVRAHGPADFPSQWRVGQTTRAPSPQQRQPRSMQPNPLVGRELSFGRLRLHVHVGAALRVQHCADQDHK